MVLWLKLVVGLFATAIVLFFFGLFVAGPSDKERRGFDEETVQTPQVEPPATTEPASR